MEQFCYQDGVLCAEQVALPEVAARFGTPCYVYSRAMVEGRWRAFDAALGGVRHRICYAVKANGSLAVLNVLARLGDGSGFDIVSGGELARVLKAGGKAENIIFSGVGKQAWEIREALRAGIGCFNIESEAELDLISGLAGKEKTRAPIAVRLNPDVDAKTHRYISTGLRENKFGVAAEGARALYERAAADGNIRVEGVACHIGSQITDLAPYRQALQRVLDFIEELAGAGIAIGRLDFGGGLGVRYSGDVAPPSAEEYGEMLVAELRARGEWAAGLEVTIEPGRAIVGEAGILLTRVQHLKVGEVGRFCVVDAAMNDLIRPALYQAEHEIVEVERGGGGEAGVYDVVGAVCESSDFLGKGRRLVVQAGDLLAVRTAGAYAAVMSSNYNARGRAAEVMVDGGEAYLVRKRETVADLYRGEGVLPG